MMVSITEQHSDLYQWFLFTQESLLLGDNQLALDAWQVFDEFLRRHIALENQFLLSDTAQQLCAESLTWPANVYRKEHEKITKLLAKTAQWFEFYSTLEGRKQRLALLDFLDHLQTFRHVLEHHEEREEKDLLKHEALLQQSEFMAQLIKLQDWLHTHDNRKQAIKTALESR